MYLIYSLYAIHCLSSELLPELVETVGQTQMKVERLRGTWLILELLSVSAAAWEFVLSRLGKVVEFVQTEKCNDGARVSCGIICTHSIVLSYF